MDDPAETNRSDSEAIDAELVDSFEEDVEPFLTARAVQNRRQIQLSARRLFPIAAVLFVLTCFSTWYVQQSLTYSVAVMSILLSHELGHFLQALRYRVPASPPLFIPMPSLFGTMGAVILQGGGFANRKALFDIAISGPLAGLVVALPIAWFGITQSTVEALPENARTLVFGDPLLLKWLIELHHGPLPPNHDVILNPLLFAGWVGIFVTALNLLPVGQLDGGHILYTLIGRRAHKVAMGLVAAAAGWMIATGNLSYVLFLMLILLFGVKHPPSADDSAPLGTGRVILGWLTLAFLFIGFTPVPLDEHSPEDASPPPTVESADAIAV
ncbi:site-2 protease family protein [bacterium]|nr:site-2 protease family protein [bacterium]